MVAHVRGGAQRRGVAREIAGRHHAGRHGETELRVGGNRRPAHGVDERGRNRPVIESLRAVVRDQPVGAREIGIAERRSDLGRPAVRRQEQGTRRRERVQPREVACDLAAEGVVDGEAVLGDGDCGLEQTLERHRPEL